MALNLDCFVSILRLIKTNKGDKMPDTFTREQDALLAETVLRHIREGSTAIAAFEEVAVVMNKSASTCGYRWNNTVRHNYRGAFRLARQKRYELKYANNGS